MKYLFQFLLLFPITAAADEQKPDPVQVKYEHCLSLQKSETTTSAIDCFNEVVALSPSSANAFYYLGRLYAETEDYPKSISALKTALKIKPDDAWAINVLIFSLLKNGDSEVAFELMKDANSRFPNFPNFKKHLINQYQKKNDYRTVDKLRSELFALVRKGIFDGLADEHLYVREKIEVNDSVTYAIEYFPTTDHSKPQFTFRTTFPDKSETVYRLEYHADMKELLEINHGKGAEPYFLDAYEGAAQRSVASFTVAPSYADIRAIVVKDLTKGGKSSRACVDGPLSTKEVSCKN